MLGIHQALASLQGAIWIAPIEPPELERLMAEWDLTRCKCGHAKTLHRVNGTCIGRNVDDGRMGEAWDCPCDEFVKASLRFKQQWRGYGRVPRYACL